MENKLIQKIAPEGRAMILAYDHGFEHGPRDFLANPASVNPEAIIEIAEKGGFSALVFHAGIAEKYQDLIKKSKVPVILKLNGKSELYSEDDYYSPQLYSVDDAISLGASALGYTCYSGSKYENRMNKEFAGIIRQAHKKNLPAVGWMYPRGESLSLGNSKTSKKAIEEKEKHGMAIDETPSVVAYGARIGMELGADIVKVKYTGSSESFNWVVKSAGPTKVVLSGGPKTDTDGEFVDRVGDVIKAGGIGIAVGRNVWQREDALEISKKLKEVIWQK